MKPIKIALVALFMGLFIQPAMSQISTNTDLAYAFGASPDTLQLDLLTSEEMEAIQGDGGPITP